MKILQYILLIIISFLLGCNKEKDVGCFMSWGEESSLNMNMDAFDSVQVNDLFQVWFHQSDDYRIEIKGGENVIKGVECYVEKNTLKIKNQNVCNWLRTYKKDITIEVYSPTVKKIILAGESDLFTKDTFETDTFFLMVYADIGTADINLNTKHCILKVKAGTGRFTFRGKSTSSYIYNFGSSFIYQDNLLTENTHAVNKSCGDLFVNTSNLLFVEKIERGDIFYKGDPEEIIVKESTGEGRLIKID